jgi:hypothetical protein
MNLVPDYGTQVVSSPLRKQLLALVGVAAAVVGGLVLIGVIAFGQSPRVPAAGGGGAPQRKRRWRCPKHPRWCQAATQSAGCSAALALSKEETDKPRHLGWRERVTR